MAVIKGNTRVSVSERLRPHTRACAGHQPLAERPRVPHHRSPVRARAKRGTESSNVLTRAGLPRGRGGPTSLVASRAWRDGEPPRRSLHPGENPHGRRRGRDERLARAVPGRRGSELPGNVNDDPGTERFFLTEEQAFLLADPHGMEAAAALLIPLAAGMNVDRSPRPSALGAQAGEAAH